MVTSASKRSGGEGVWRRQVGAWRRAAPRWRAGSCSESSRFDWFLEFPRIEIDEAVAVGHLHLHDGVLVQHVRVLDDAVDAENIGDAGIDLVIGQRFGRVPWHRPAHEIEYHGGVRPIGPDRQHLLRGRFQSALSPEKARRDAALSLVAVTRGAFLSVDRRPLCGCAATRDQPLAFPKDGNLPPTPLTISAPL